jgi:trans-aconitate methyltransferase
VLITLNSLKQSFNFAASSYEKYRPNYPEQLYKDIIEYAELHPNDSLLEIGGGTGKATEGFIQQGYSNITCIEYGENLAELTKAKFSAYPHVHVVHSAFEDWNSAESQYALAFSGTAFHFIPSEIGYPKTALHLKKDGVAAFFWFVHIASNEPVYQSIREVYKEYAPHLDDSSIPSLEEFIQERSELTLQSGHFHRLKAHTYKWDQIYTPSDYIGLLTTHSGHQVLPEDQKDELFRGIEEVILNRGGTITKKHAVALFLAKKK